MIEFETEDFISRLYYRHPVKNFRLSQVSRDLVHWAQMPVSLWNGLEYVPIESSEDDSDEGIPASGTGEWIASPYDSYAIYTGSAVLVPGAAPDGKGLGVIQIYPGMLGWDRADLIQIYPGMLG